MDTFYLEYRDPLFGVIIFFTILFVISFFSYWWGRHKQTQEHKNLESFLNTFDNESSDISSQVDKNSLTPESWLMLSRSYAAQGNFEQSIKIYHALLAKNKDPIFQKDTLLLLGKSLYSAGFLERSRKTFMQLLSQSPRIPEALHYLLLIYEQLQQFDKALEVSLALQEQLGTKSQDKLFLEAKILINDSSIESEQKAQKLLAIYKDNHDLKYLIFEWLFKNRPSLAWSNFDQSLSYKISDILYNLSLEDIDLSVVESNSFLRELYSAKGYLNLAENSSIFELDLLISLNKHNIKKAALSFEYSCTHCKQISFLPFHRCSNCHKIDTIEPSINITKDYFEIGHSFL